MAELIIKKNIDTIKGNFRVNKSRGHCFLFLIYIEHYSSDILVNYQEVLELLSC